ncbi:Uu.00g008660.m01.CDS01 [Anthostomella pinea]|uniref:Uu.00g008660.m01.CDS01 n=1 Tax=Anthostomella pinea TaxID=933095 RepID=A0AAI8VX85_9PEZI|nr:Uu.00g008660.m01.CDS01 [Anthostomella pinea]
MEMEVDQVSHDLLEGRQGTDFEDRNGPNKTSDKDLQSVQALLGMMRSGRISFPVDSNEAFMHQLRSALSSTTEISNHEVSPPSQDLESVGDTQIPIGTKRKCATDASNGSVLSPKKQKLDSSTQLPSEIISMILSQAMDENPTCALDLLVPDWNICKRETPELEKFLEVTRIVTLNAAYYGECIRHFHRNSTHVFLLDVAETPISVTDENFLTNWEQLFPLRGQRAQSVLPYDDEPRDVPKHQAPFMHKPMYEDLRHIVIHSPLKLVDVTARSMFKVGDGLSEADLDSLDNALDLDRAAHLWLSWSRMPRLESVLLDLRIYSQDLNTERGCLSKSMVIEQVQEMGRCLRLKLLVIAGLQSYSLETGCKSLIAEEIEEEDELDGQTNWIKVFRPALWPGGKLVLVDRLVDEIPSLALGAEEGQVGDVV